VIVEPRQQVAEDVGGDSGICLPAATRSGESFFNLITEQDCQYHDIGDLESTTDVVLTLWCLRRCFCVRVSPRWLVPEL